MFEYLRASYTTGPGYLESKNYNGNPVLKRESSEQYQEYHSRIDRCPIRNHIGIIIDRYHSSAVKTDVERDESFEEFYRDYQPIFNDALKESQIVGSCYIILQLNDAELLSELDLQIYIVPEDSVLEYQEENLFAFKEVVSEDEEYKIIYTDDGSWVKLRGEEVVEEGWSGFNELPVIKMNPDFPGISQVGMLAPIQESLTNLLSLHMEESLQSTYTRHLIGGLSDIPQTFEDEQRVQRMMSGKKLLLFKDPVSVSSLAADASQGQNLLTAIGQTEDMLYAVAGLRLSEPVRESGLAKKIEMEQFNDIKHKLVRALEKAENKFIELLNNALGTAFSFSNYTTETINQTWSEKIDELSRLMSLGLSEEFIQQVKEKFESEYLLEGD